MSTAGVHGAASVDDGPFGQLRQLLPVGSVPLHVGVGPVPAGYRMVEAWRVVPGPGRPRLLVPLDPAAARRVIVAHVGLRDARVRLQRRAAAATVGPLGVLSGDRTVLRVSVPEVIDEAVVEDLFVTRHLVRRIPGAALTALSLRGGHARAKPTVQLVGADGRVVAFAKVAADLATAGRVRREAALLERFGAALPPDGPLRLPRLLAAGSAGAFTYSVVDPLPDDVRGGRDGDGRRALAGLAALRDAIGVRMDRLASAALCRDALARLDDGDGRTGADGGVEAVRSVAVRLAAIVRTLDGNVELPLGPFHGDWVPWNVGWSGRTMWAWDLEDGSEEGPVGLDALRWVFLVELVGRRRGLAAAVRSMTAAGPCLLPRLGVEPALTPVLVRLHLIDYLASALTVAAAGRGLPSGLDGVEDALAEVVP